MLKTVLKSCLMSFNKLMKYYTRKRVQVIKKKVMGYRLWVMDLKTAIYYP